MAARCALLGLGIMGSRMAGRLLDAGVPLTVWNRDPAKSRPFAERGATVAPDPPSAVAGCRHVVLMLADGAAVEQVLWESGLAAALTQDATVVDMASISPADARGHARRLAERGIAYLDAPVSGGARGAQDGTLTIMVGGEPAAFEGALPLLAPLGRASRIGPSGAGQVAKAANQLIVGVTIGAVAEALVLAEAAGADPTAVREALMGGFADSRILREHGRRMIDGDFTPGARIATQLKDLRTIAALAREVGLGLPLASRVTELYTDLEERLGSDLDHSALFLGLRGDG